MPYELVLTTMGKYGHIRAVLYSKIFHYNNSFLHEFIDKNFQL